MDWQPSDDEARGFLSGLQMHESKALDNIYNIPSLGAYLEEYGLINLDLTKLTRQDQATVRHIHRELIHTFYPSMRGWLGTREQFRYERVDDQPAEYYTGVPRRTVYSGRGDEVVWEQAKWKAQITLATDAMTLEDGHGSKAWISVQPETPQVTYESGVSSAASDDRQAASEGRDRRRLSWAEGVTEVTRGGRTYWRDRDLSRTSEGGEQSLRRRFF